MNRKDQLNFCKVCIHRKNDLQKGIVCAITDTYADFDFNCQNYKEDENLAKKDIKTSNSNKNKYLALGGVFGLLAIIGIGYFTYNSQNNTSKVTPKTEQINIINDNSDQLAKRQLIKNQPKAISYFATADRIAIKRSKINKDTSFLVAKNVQITLHKRYYASFVKDDILPVLAISRGYCFIVNKVKKDNSKSLTEQWSDLRKEFSPNFSYNSTKKYSLNNMLVEEMNFTIPGHRNVSGVSKLIEIGNERYFFHFAFKQENTDYKMLRKFLNLYVVIK